MSMTFTEQVILVKESCYRCGVTFAMPESLQKTALRDHSVNFFCPNGHGQVYTGETEAQRIQKLLENQKIETQRIREAYFIEQREHEATAKKVNAARKEVKRLKVRAKAGVCPCCHRTISQMARHMASKHPEFVAPSKEVNGERLG